MLIWAGHKKTVLFKSLARTSENIAVIESFHTQYISYSILLHGFLIFHLFFFFHNIIKHEPGTDPDKENE